MMPRMKMLFVHQNMPGQHREMIRWLAEQGGHELVFLTQRKNMQLDGVRTVTYGVADFGKHSEFGLIRPVEEIFRTGFAAAQAAEALRDEGFTPDIILGHVGWGEMTFLREVYPDVPQIGFFEYFYRTSGGLVGFDPEAPVGEYAGYFAHMRNMVSFSNIQTVDKGLSPMRWQRDRFPESFHDKIYVCHDGIRTDLLTPDPDTEIRLGRLERPLSRADEIVTYVARNMEKARGFHMMMRALPEILAARPEARVIMVGGNESSYSAAVDTPGGLRAEMEAELGGRVDWSRVHFVGRVPYEDFCRLIRISRCHVYLTMPFVLSWSLLESMSMQATVVASDVAPVREAITHGQTGLLVDFFDPGALARQVVDVLSNPEAHAHLGPAARAHVVENYDFLTRCLPEHLRQINALVPEDRRIAF